MNHAQLTQLDKAFDKIYTVCVHHLDSVTQHNVGSLDFNFDDEHTYTCMCQLAEPLKIKFKDFAIEDFFIIFEVTGQISIDKPIYQGRRNSGANTCSFWVESQPNRVSRALWRRIPSALHAIATRAALPVDLSQMYEEDQETGKVTLFFEWASDEPSELLNVSVLCIN